MAKAPECDCKSCVSRRAAQKRWCDKNRSTVRAYKKNKARQRAAQLRAAEPSDEELDRRAMEIRL